MSKIDMEQDALQTTATMNLRIYEQHLPKAALDDSVNSGKIQEQKAPKVARLESHQPDVLAKRSRSRKSTSGIRSLPNQPAELSNKNQKRKANRQKRKDMTKDTEGKTEMRSGTTKLIVIRPEQQRRPIENCQEDQETEKKSGRSRGAMIALQRDASIPLADAKYDQARPPQSGSVPIEALDKQENKLQAGQNLESQNAAVGTSVEKKKRMKNKYKAKNPANAAHVPSPKFTGRSTPSLQDAHSFHSLTSSNQSNTNKALPQSEKSKALRKLTNPKQDRLLQAAMLANNRNRVNAPRPTYNKPRHKDAVDPDKFEVGPLPRETRGFQPRRQMHSVHPASSITTTSHEILGDQEATPTNETASQPGSANDLIAATSDFNGFGPQPIEKSGLPAADQILPLTQITTQLVEDKKSKITATPPKTQPSQPTFLPGAKQSARTLEINTLEQSHRSRGLEASMWASSTKQPKNLADFLPDLRRPSPIWDASSGYSIPISTGQRLSYNTNVLPKDAWKNVGFKPEVNTRTDPSTNESVSPQLTSRPPHADDASIRAPPNSTAISERLAVISSDQATINPIDVPAPDPVTESHGSPLVSDALSESAARPDLTLKVQDKYGESSVSAKYLPPHLRTPDPPHQETNLPKISSMVVESSLSTGETPSKLAESKPEHTVPQSMPSTPLPSEQTSKFQGEAAFKAVDQEDSKLPPHLRGPKVAVKTFVTELHPVPKIENAMSKYELPKPPTCGTPKSSSLKGKVMAPLGQQPMVTDKQDSTSATRTSPGSSSKPKSQTKATVETNGYNGKDWDKPFQTVHPMLGWDGKRIGHNDGWESRSRSAVPEGERLKLLEMWAKAGEKAQDKATIYIDTASPEFALGTGIVHDGSLSAGLSDEAHFTRRLPNDPLTLARSDQTAQSVVEEHNAKRREEPTDDQLTKKEKKALREAMRQRDAEIAALPNPFKPTADIYIRPAKVQDLPQIAEIYNHFIRTTAVALELDDVTRDAWRMRMEDCREEGYDMFVAVQRNPGGNGNTARERKQPIYGFAYAEDQNDRRSSCRFTAIVQVYVSWRHLRIGVGRCLLDRVMDMLNVNHYRKKGVPWEGDPLGKQREVKKVLIEIPYWDDSEEENAIREIKPNEQTGKMEEFPGWKARWLESVQFERVSILPAIGFKKACLPKGKTVSIATFMLDTWVDISKAEDHR